MFERFIDGKFRDIDAGTHLAGIMDLSSKVSVVDGGAAVINITEIGADPIVLIDNSVYPIAKVVRTDTAVLVQLRKLDTTNTDTSDDSLYGVTTPIIESATQQHVERLWEQEVALANQSIAPQAQNLSATVMTGLFLTTGALDPATGRKKCLPQDVINMGKFMDKQKISKTGRKLVLCSDHHADLLTASQVYFQQYSDIREGKVLKLWGFDIFMEVDMPRYQGTAGNPATMAKVAFGAVASVNDRNGSFAYHNRNCVKASTASKMYYREARLDPENRSSVMGFRRYTIVMPKRTLGICAMVSDN